jgi:hypothetical protein
MSPFEVDANSNHGISTVALATATMNGSVESNSKPNVSSQNSHLRNNDSANPNTTSNANKSPTRRFSVPVICYTLSNIRKASHESTSTAPASLESTTGRKRGPSITKAIRQSIRSTSISLQQSFKRQRDTNNEETNQEEIVHSEIYALDLPPWISRDKSEIDYIKRTESKLSPDLTHLAPLSLNGTGTMSHSLTFLGEEFLGNAEESMLLCLPPLPDDDEEELNIQTPLADQTLNTANVELDQNNTENAGTTPISPEIEEATSNTQQQIMSGDLRDTGISTSTDQEISEANEISISIACFSPTTETNSESTSNNNNNNAAGASRANDMPRAAPNRQPHTLSYYRRPRQKV